jgi:DNA-binding NtrC family response regulator
MKPAPNPRRGESRLRRPSRFMRPRLPESHDSARLAPVRALVVDGDAALRRAWARALIAAGHEVLTAEDFAGAAAMLATGAPTVLVGDGAIVDAATSAGELDPKRAPPIVASCDARLEPEALARLEAFAFALVARGTVPPLGLGVLAVSATAARVRTGGPKAAAEVPFVAIASTTRRALERTLAVVDAPTPALLVGEDGVGKRTLARLLHRRGPRRVARFELVPCAELRPDALERTLFVDGGPFERVAGGLVVLDRVDALPPVLQRDLAEWFARGAPLAGARVVATARPDVLEARANGTFRGDLFFALAVTIVEVPPLRSRRDDIPALVQERLLDHARRYGGVAPRFALEALRRVRNEDWVGNVPELFATVDRAASVARGGVVVEGDLGLGGDARRDRGRASARPEATFAEARAAAVARFERDYVVEALAATGGNVTQAARLAGLDRANFRRILRRNGVGPAARGEDDEAT